MKPEEKLFQEFMKMQGIENPAWNIEEDRLMTYYEYGVKMLSAGRAMKCADIDPLIPLIQGYTAEQWQEIIDGGYLCEFGGSGNKNSGLLEEIKGGDYPFQQEDGSDWTNCRPAQIKGVMRPIFVEPVDKEAFCVFFDLDGKAMHSGMMRFSNQHNYNFQDSNNGRMPTKYIEV